jgi:hypothetical protein
LTVIDARHAAAVVGDFFGRSAGAEKRVLQAAAEVGRERQAEDAGIGQSPERFPWEAVDAFLALSDLACIRCHAFFDGPPDLVSKLDRLGRNAYVVPHPVLRPRNGHGLRLACIADVSCPISA